jgi:hypothetical protein
MQALTRRRWAVLGVLVLGLGAAGVTGACGSNESGPLDSCPTPPDTPTDTPTACPAPIEEPCLRYHIPLDGNPSTDVALRSKYIAAFGTPCYMSEAATFDCFFFTNNNPPADEVKRLNNAPPYTP